MRKKGMHKKLASVLVAAAMVMTSLPTYAATPGDLPSGVTVEDVEATEAAAVPAMEGVSLQSEEAVAAQDSDGTEGTTQEMDVVRIGEKGYSSLQEAIDAVEDGETITLLKDVESNTTIATAKNFTLDLAGKKVTGTAKFVFDLYGDNIICDSSEEKSGEILNISGETHNYGVRVNGGNVEVRGGTFSAAYGLRVVSGGSLDFKGGTSQGTMYGIVVSGQGKAAKQTTLSVSGGTIKSDSIAISGNGTEDNTKIEITGGEIISKNLGIYHPQEGDLTIEGNAKIEAPNGVQYCGSGNLTINDHAQIHATGAYTPFPSKPAEQGDGSADDGAALSLVSRGDGYQSPGEMMNVTINGGTLISDNNAAISVYRLAQINDKWVTNEETSVENFLGSLNITGGTMKGTTSEDNAKPIFEIDTPAADCVNVSGGSYNQVIPAEYCADGYLPTENGDGSYLVTEGGVAQIGAQRYPTLQRAVDAAENGAVIKVLGDYVSKGSVIIRNKENITLDLGGHTLKAVNAEGRFSTVLKTTHSTLVIQHGNIETANKVWEAAVGCDRGSKVTVASDAVISGDFGLGIKKYFSEGAISTAGSGTEIHIYGKVEGINDPEILKAGGRGGITINGQTNSTTDYPKFYIYSGAVIKGYPGTSGNVNNDDAPAIYAAGYGEWTIEEGAELSGDEALSIKAGIFHINGGKFIANGKHNANPDAWSNGTEPTGAAINITGNTDYARNVQMDIKGGTFEAKDGYALVEAITKGESAFGSLSISGGVFSGGQDKAIYVSNENVTQFVSGGYFGQPIDTKYIAENKVLLPDATHGYKVADASDEANAEPAVGDSQVNMEDADIPDDLKQAVEVAAKEVKVNEEEFAVYARQAASEISDASAENAETQAREELELSESETVHVYAQTFLDIKPVAFKKSEGGASAVYTLDIVPKYQLVASTAEKAEDFVFEPTESEEKNAIKVGDPENLKNVTNVSISIPLPNGFIADVATQPESLWVKHESEEGVFYHDAKLVKDSTDNTYSVSFFNKEGFSTFTILAADTVAEVNGVGYNDLNAAIQAANGDEVTLLSDVTSGISVPEGTEVALNLNGHKVEGSVTNQGTLTIDDKSKEKNGVITGDITSNGTTNIKGGNFEGELVKEENGKFSISGGTFAPGQLKNEYLAPGYVIDGNTVRPATPSGGGGGTTAPSYTITAPVETEEGKVTASSNSANQGDIVTLTVESKEGYELDELIVTDASGAKIELTKTADGKFTFRMPGSNVEIKVSFKVKGQQEQEIAILKAQARDLADRTLNDKDTKVKFAKGKAPKTDVTYETSNDKVVAVDEEGHIRYTGLGEAVITVKAVENEEYKAAEVSVTVKVGLKQPTFTPSSRDNGFTVTSSTVKGTEKFQVQYVLKGRSFQHDSAKSKTFTVDNKLRKGKVSAANKKTYRIRVRAISGDFKSKWSPVKTITTK